MKLLIAAFCCAFAFGQTTSTAPDQKTEPSASATQKKSNKYGLGIGAKGVPIGGVEVLSDTQGVDFSPYLQRVRQDIERNWHSLVPQSVSRKGNVAIECAIAKDGKLADMFLIARPKPDDDALVRAAWGGITKSNPFPPLPSKFAGSFIALRFRFDYNP